MTDTSMTFAVVTETFERVYEQLREDSGENAPNSNLYYAETVEEIVEQAGRAVQVRNVVEVGGGDTVGWIYDLNNDQFYRIGDNASEPAVMTEFSRIMGYDF